MEQPRLAAVLRALERRVERHRDRDVRARRKELREHLPLLRIEKDEAVHPEPRALHERRGWQFFDEEVHHVLSVIIAPLHRRTEALGEQRKIAELVRERVIRLRESIRRLAQRIRRELIALELFERL